MNAFTMLLKYLGNEQHSLHACGVRSGWTCHYEEYQLHHARSFPPNSRKPAWVNRQTSLPRHVAGCSTLSTRTTLSRILMARRRRFHHWGERVLQIVKSGSRNFSSTTRSLTSNVTIGKWSLLIRRISSGSHFPRLCYLDANDEKASLLRNLFPPAFKSPNW